MTLRRLVVATANAGKLSEIRVLLEDAPVEVLGLHELREVRLPEEGGDYGRNALAKARAAAEQLGEWAVGDDSGLEVEALGGAPGPLSARYGGPGLDDAERARRLLCALENVPRVHRSAAFVCDAAWVTPDGEERLFHGRCPGSILAAPRGTGGFGYDPVFQPEGFTQSLAELPADQKNAISHRGQAFRALSRALSEKLDVQLR